MYQLPKDYKDFHWITPNIALGNIKAGTQFDRLKMNDIKAVVVALPSLPRSKMDYVMNDISFLHISSNDHPSQDLSMYFPMVFDFISSFVESGKNVLVHCHAGVSRSTTLLTSYLMAKRKQNHSEVLRHIRSRRSYINPNSGFLQQLKRHDKALRDN
jgi:protein-tyrosine phosphatase